MGAKVSLNHSHYAASYPKTLLMISKKNPSFNSIQDPYFNESTKIFVINLGVIKCAYLEKGIAIIKYVLMLILRGKTACRWQKNK